MNEIFSEKVVTSRRTYYFDVKETRDGTKYLGIGESTQVGADVERHRVMVFEESLDDFMEGLDKAVEFIQRNESEEHYADGVSEGTEQIAPSNGKREMMELLKRVEAKIDEVRGHFSTGYVKRSD